MAQQRPQFTQLLTQIGNGETLVVSKLNRFGPDAHDVGGTIKLLASRNIKVIVLQLGALGMSSPAGKMMLTMLAAVAELERPKSCPKEKKRDQIHPLSKQWAAYMPTR